MTGRVKRKFKPNIQRIRVLDPEGRVLRLKISTRVIKKGVITLKRGDKTVSFPLVKALHGRNKGFNKHDRADGQDSGDASQTPSQTSSQPSS